MLRWYNEGAVASQVMPSPVAEVLLAPIAFNTANDLGISPYPSIMVVAISASAAFLSPVEHPVNILVMGPGGYRFVEYTKVGIPPHNRGPADCPGGCARLLAVVSTFILLEVSLV